MAALYDHIGQSYGATRRADPAIAATLARLLQLQAATRCLDLGCGSGNYTLALAAMGGHWTGIDASAGMLRQARQRSARVAWLQADASALPFAARRFDAVLCTLAIHHFANLRGPFAEVARVLRTGPLVIFTAFCEQMHAYWLGHYFPRMMQRSIHQMPARAAVVDALRAAGFGEPQIVPFHVPNDLQDLFLYSGKHRPGLYLDAAVRANISSFARLCPPKELERGLAALRADIDSGRFAASAAHADEENGDYAFVVAHTG